jgi:hypothetical protein
VRIEIAVESQLDIGPLYLVNHLAAAWRETGHAVRVRPVPEPPGGPDIALLHVDRSVIPESIVERLGYACPVVNGAVLDITKRRVSRQLVARDHAYDGQVIVKTNNNYFGLPERWRAPQPGGIRGLLSRAVSRVFQSRDRPFVGKEYPIYPHPGAVPRWIWRSRRYVVERFTPEREGEHFVLRNWLFLGDREVGITSWSREPIVKASNIERHELETGVPDELRAMRRALAFDYGKFDWVLVDGRAVLLDANRTPTVQPRTARFQAVVADLARGIGSFLPQA